MRLFVAMPVTPHAAFQEATAALRAGVPGLRPVPEGAWHVTLRFLGEMPDPAPASRALRDALAGAQACPGRVVHVGAFPSPRRARVVWAGVLAPGMEDVARRVVAATRGMGEPPEERAFVPHVTLARLREPRDVARALAPLAGREFGPTPFDEVVLHRSILGPSGPAYEALGRFPLAAPGSGPGQA